MKEQQQTEKPGPSGTSGVGFSKPRIFPPIWLAIAFIAMAALDRWLPLAHVFTGGASLPAWLVMAAGLAVVLIAANGFRRARTGIVPFSESTSLVTSGIYRYTRNPMYLGMVLILAGLAIKLGSLSAWIPIPVFVIVIQRQFIRNEELFLSGIYGDEFLEYKRRVRRWI